MGESGLFYNRWKENTKVQKIAIFDKKCICNKWLDLLYR